MKNETLVVRLKNSGIADTTGLIVTVRSITPEDVEVAVGFPGIPNVLGTMRPGDAVLLETPSRGLLEARLLSFSYQNDVAEILITEVSPRIGLVAGAAEVDPANAPFTESELEQVSQSVKDARERVANIRGLQPEQIQLIQRKLDEIGSAASRMGRKDWVNYAAGSLTSLCITAAFAPEVTRGIFSAVNAAFVWLFTSGILLIQ
jgi:hypothetical protein